jgi:hypothetical protein
MRTDEVTPHHECYVAKSSHAGVDRCKAAIFWRRTATGTDIGTGGARWFTHPRLISLSTLEIRPRFRRAVIEIGASAIIPSESGLAMAGAIYRTCNGGRENHTSFTTEGQSLTWFTVQCTWFTVECTWFTVQCTWFTVTVGTAG